MLHDFFIVLIAIFVALDVIGTLPIFVTMTRDLEARERATVVNTSMVVAFVVALAFMVFGEKIFGYLGIGIADFKIAGGVVLLLISLADLVSHPEVAHRASGSTGVVPLAVPLITGPGVLTTLILQVNRVGYLVTVLALLVNYLFAWFLLRRSETVTRLIGKDGTTVISKIAALLLAAIAVALIRSGAFEAVRAFQTG